MKITVTIKELLVMLDVILFGHVRFHKYEYHALVGTPDASREDLTERITNTIIDVLSNKNETEEIEFADIDIINLLGYIYNFAIYKDYERYNRFKGEDIEDLKKRLEEMQTNKD